MASIKRFMLVPILQIPAQASRIKNGAMDVSAGYGIAKIELRVVIPCSSADVHGFPFNGLPKSILPLLQDPALSAFKQMEKRWRSANGEFCFLLSCYVACC